MTPAISGVTYLLAKQGRMTVRLTAEDGELTLDLSDAAAEELAQFLVHAVQDVKSDDYDPALGSLQESATDARIEPGAKPSDLGISDRLQLVIKGQGAIRITLNIGSTIADKLIADAEAHSIRKHRAIKN